MSLILGLDSSGKTAGVCLRRDGRTLYEELLDEGLTHSETLLPLVKRALGACHLAPADFNAFAVTAGPGSFTGLRIGLSLAKGMALPGGIPLVPVSTLEAMARAAGREGIVLAALNARRGEVYWAAFRLGKRLERLTPDAASPAAQAEEFLKKQREQVFVVGDGAELCYTESNYTKTAEILASPLPIALGAALAAEEAVLAGRAIPAEEARPNYLRLSQAERERLAKNLSSQSQTGR